METVSLDDMIEKHLGPKGTPVRDRFDRDVEADAAAFRLGKAIKEERRRMKLTQKELGDRAGVGESTVSKVERGRATSLSSLFGIFKALDIPAGSMDLGRMGRVALW